MMKQEVSHALRETLEKAKAHGGDPFSEYRRKRILPEKFEYGTNCLLDRFFELLGGEIVQRAYEKIRKNPRAYTIQEDVSGVDLDGVPILFTVKLGVAIDASNEARADERQQRHTKEYKKVAGKIQKFLEQEPRFLQRLADEPESETTWRLAVICAGLDDGAKRLEKEKRHESDTVAVYVQVIQQLPFISRLSVSSKEIDSLMTASVGIGRAIAFRDEKVGIEDFLLQLGPSFWNVLLEGMLSHDYFVRAEASDQAEWMAEQIQKWKEEVDSLRSPEKSVDVIFERIWNEIRDCKIKQQIEVEEEFPQESHHKYRKFLPERMAFLFLVVLGYEGDFTQIIRSADSSALKSLFNKLLGELPSRKKWYEGNGSARSILES
jgi:hypothetical protein